MPTRLVLIRHGESASNAGRWLSGIDTCGGLSDLGRVQAERLRDRLAASGERPDVLLSSTMPRAVQTAEIVAEAVDGVEVDAREELGERTPGECEGMTHDEYEQRYGKRPWADWEEALSPGGESNEEFLARVRRVIPALAQEHDGRTLWVVCHGGIIMSTAALLMGTQHRGAVPIWGNPANTAVSEWVHWEGQWLCTRYNDAAHLEGLTPA